MQGLLNYTTTLGVFSDKCSVEDNKIYRNFVTIFLQTCLTRTSSVSFLSISNPKYFATDVRLILSPPIFKESRQIRNFFR